MTAKPGEGEEISSVREDWRVALKAPLEHIRTDGLRKQHQEAQCQHAREAMRNHMRAMLTIRREDRKSCEVPKTKSSATRSSQYTSVSNAISLDIRS